MMGLGKPQLHAKVEVAIVSRCTNIKGEPYLHTNLKLQAFSTREICGNLFLIIGINQNGEPLIFGKKLTLASDL